MSSAQVIEGDCLEVMPTLDADSVDAIVTDPPYGLKFMGKAWDHGVPAEPFWREALRVAKPGAHLVAFGGTRTYHRLACAIEDAGWEIRDCLSWLYGSGFPKSHNGPWGGTALKPGWEPIILARKPLAGTVEGNHAKHGTGALNIDGCRIGTGDDKTDGGCAGVSAIHGGGITARAAVDFTKGRWPANVVLDEEAAGLLDGQSGELASGGTPANRGPDISRVAYGAFKGYTPEGGVGANVGGASRFFYTAKASRSERNAGLDHLPKKASLIGAEGHKINPMTGPAVVDVPRANVHPTVKPLDLMQWLCRLVTPKGGLILDPFTGSGSTGRAAIAEGFRFIGIELSEEYAAIARARIAEYAPLFTDGAA